MNKDNKERREKLHDYLEQIALVFLFSGTVWAIIAIIEVIKMPYVSGIFPWDKFIWPIGLIVLGTIIVWFQGLSFRHSDQNYRDWTRNSKISQSDSNRISGRGVK